MCGSPIRTKDKLTRSVKGHGLRKQNCQRHFRNMWKKYVLGRVREDRAGIRTLHAFFLEDVHALRGINRECDSKP